MADPRAHVMHDHWQECLLAGGPIAVLLLLDEHSGAEGDLDRTARRTVHHSVREHVEEHLLVLGLVVEELGIGERSVCVVDVYLDLFTAWLQLDYVGDLLSCLL